MNEVIDFGIVKIIKGKYKGYIGYFDDEDGEYSYEKAIVYLGDPKLSTGYIIVPYEYIDDKITTEDLYKRQNKILQKFSEAKFSHDIKKQSQLLAEYLLIETIFSERYIKARFTQKVSGKRIFISHSSVDKTFAKLLATDLAEAGHKPWLDEWEIKVGSSIPKEISKGIEECDYLIIILSKTAVLSNWVENEWQSVYWDEVKSGTVKIIPVLIEKCNVPRLLAHKKYAKFTSDYSYGLDEILHALC